MGTMSPQEEAFWQFVHQLDRSIEHHRSILQSILAERESPSESESEDIESSPANSYGAAVQRIPLEVRRLCGDDAAKEYEEWSRGVNWATNPLNVVTPNFVRRSDRVLRRAGLLLSNAVHDDPAQANSGKGPSVKRKLSDFIGGGCCSIVPRVVPRPLSAKGE